MKYLLQPLLSSLRTAAQRAGSLALLLSVAGSLRAQPVPRAVVVEHFTNTLCSICASRNPGFYANLRQQPGALHIAYHPSSPYRACQFSQQNTAENDARTNFYGVYGSTPRLVLNGNALPATADYSAAALFAPYRGQTSPLALQVALGTAGADSLVATVRVETRAAHTLGALRLFLALAEDTVAYAAPNGEGQHYDVFRKAFGSLLVTPSPAVGGVVVLRRAVAKSALWRLPSLYALAIVQQQSTTAPTVEQAAASARLGTALATAGGSAQAQRFQVFPNPATATVAVPAEFSAHALELYNSLGQRLSVPAGAPLNVRSLAPGQYLLRAVAPDGRRWVARFVKE